MDEGIAPLILEMWRAGIRTYQSCQGNPPGWIWLQFDSSSEVEQFLNIIGLPEADENSLHDRMIHGYDPRLRRRKRQWRDEVVADDLMDMPRMTRFDDWEGPMFQVLIAIHFPESDLPEVLQRLIEFNSYTA